MNQPILLNRREVKRRFGDLAETTFKRAIRRGDVPAPVKLARKTLWPEHEVTAAIERLSNART